MVAVGRLLLYVATWVAYPSLRVEREELEEEELGGLPPGLLRPTSLEPLDLQIYE